MLCSPVFPSFLFSPICSAWVVSSDLSLTSLMSPLMGILKDCISDTILLKNYYFPLTLSYIFISQMKSLMYSHMSTFSTWSHVYGSCVFCLCSARRWKKLKKKKTRSWHPISPWKGASVPLGSGAPCLPYYFSFLMGLQKVWFCSLSDFLLFL